MYAAPGVYTVTLTVADDQGATGSTSRTVEALPPNVAPVASFTAAADGLSVSVDGTASSDSDGQVTTYSWDFGDGTTADEATANHTYANAGTYTITLTVTDDRGGQAQAAQDVVVERRNLAPTASFTATADGLGVAVDGAASSDEDGRVVSYAWTFGDGAMATGPKATHEYAAPGAYQITLTVTDNEGATGQATSEVTVEEKAENQIPVPVISTTVKDLTVDVDGAGSTDPDGAIVAYEWDFGDGSPVASGAAGSYTYAKAGTYTVKLTVTDDQGATASTTSDVTVTAPDDGGEDPKPPIVDPQVVVSDAFNRLAEGAWGTADQGGDWTLSTASSYSVDGSRGVITIPRAGQTRTATLVSASVRDVDLVTDFATDVASTSSSYYHHVLVRVDGKSHYRFTVRLRQDGQAEAYLYSVVDGVAKKLAGSVLRDFAPAAGQKVNLHLTAVGEGETKLEARVWLGDEPEAPTVSAIDSTPELAKAGGVGIMSYIGGTMQELPYVVRIDNLAVNGGGGSGVIPPEEPDPPIVDPTLAASDSFGRTASRSWGKSDVGGDWWVSSPASFSVDGASGVISVPGAGQTRSATLKSVAARDVDLVTDFAADVASTTGSYYHHVQVRADGNTAYRLTVRVRQDGHTETYLYRMVDGQLTKLAGKLLKDFAPAPGENVNVRLSAVGEGETALQARVWLGDKEPQEATLQAVDNAPELARPGAVGFLGYVGGTVKELPFVVRVDNLTVTTR